MHNDWTARPWHMPEGLHSTNWIVQRALEFLERRDPSCPFFIVVSFYAAHPPLTPPEFYFDRYLRADIPEPVIGEWASPPDEDWHRTGAGGININLTGEALRSCRAGYYGMINHVDDQLRRLLSPITGVQKMTGGNTVVMLTSDHGEMLGDHYLYHKRLPYDPAARIPLMISAPDAPGGQICDQPVCLEDIMPTVLDLAGAEIPGTVEGRSLLPFLRGENADWRDALHIEHSPSHQSLTDGREKYIWFVREGREQFFDLTEDPEELHNLIESEEHQEAINHWRRRLVETLKDRPEGFSDGKALIPGRPYNTHL
jgi:arylsulfatase A-like enzyme